MKISEAGARLIAEFEGFSAKPYKDPVGVWTIGFGSTKGVGPNTPPVTREQAMARLMNEVNVVYGAAINALDLPLTQCQFDALVSFVYNVGPGGVAASTTVGKRLRAHDWQGAADALLAWDKAGGRVLPGLTRRRQAERALFLSSPARDPLAGYPADEKRWIREYDDLKRRGANRARRAVLRTVMGARRRAIWTAASIGGWGKRKRRARWHSLKARTG